MEHMFQSGFLGTKAPFFIDIAVIFIGLIPFILALAIWIAKKEYHIIHRNIQIILFLTTLMVLVYSVYNLYQIEFYQYIQNSCIDSNLIKYFTIFYIVIEVITIIVWYYTIKFAIADSQRRALPGLYTTSHKKSGKVSTFLIVFSSIISIFFYIALFVI
jgi:putative membrane protein